MLINDKSNNGQNNSDKLKSIADNMPTQDIKEIAHQKNELEQLEKEEIHKTRNVAQNMLKGQRRKESEKIAKKELAEKNKRYQD